MLRTVISLSARYPFLLSALSSLLLILAFPKTSIMPVAWIGLVPLFLALDNKSLRAAFGLSYLCGLLFFAGTLYWFVFVTVIGAILFILYLSLYFGIFGWIYWYFQKKSSGLRMIALPAAWVILEYIRGHFLSGFGWSSLGQSQYQNLLAIQIADVTGMYGVSYLIVLVNISAQEVWRYFFQEKEKGFIARLLLTTILLAAVIGYGIFRLATIKPSSRVNMAIIQANIPQELKWPRDAWPIIMERYQDITKAAAEESPQLIIWPETAFPGFIGEDDLLLDQLKNSMRGLGVALLFGSVVKNGPNYYNSAILLSKEGTVGQMHHKLHLVPFGEFVPLRRWFPFLTDIVPIADFSAGTSATLFAFPPEEKDKTPPPLIFSVLICFEDTVSHLSRIFVHKGADVLINLTNDAWFRDTKEPYMHLAASVFRTIENRRSLVRAANTGVSGLIDARGRIVSLLKDPQGKATYVSGYQIVEVPVFKQRSFYTQYGSVFLILCLALVVIGIAKKN